MIRSGLGDFALSRRQNPCCSMPPAPGWQLSRSPPLSHLFSVRCRLPHAVHLALIDDFLLYLSPAAVIGGGSLIWLRGTWGLAQEGLLATCVPIGLSLPPHPRFPFLAPPSQKLPKSPTISCQPAGSPHFCGSHKARLSVRYLKSDDR